MFLVAILALLGAISFCDIRNGAWGLLGQGDTQLGRALAALIIATGAALSGELGAVAFIGFCAQLWIAMIPGLNPETSVAITGAPDSTGEKLQPGLEQLEQRIVLPTDTFWHRKEWGLFWTACRLAVYGIPVAYLAVVTGHTGHAFYGFATPLLALAYTAAGFIPVSDQRKPAERMVGAGLGLITALVLL